MIQSATTIEIRVKPRSKHDRISLLAGGRVEVAVTSPPVEGKANEHVVKLLAKKLGVAKSSLYFVKGEGSRDKVVAVQGIERSEVSRRLRE